MNQPLEPFLVVSTTLPSEQDAQRLARILVERKYAACVHVSGPVQSTYLWKGAVESENEWVCQAKIRSNWFQRIEETITENHPYEVPEIVSVKLAKISSGYAEWLNDQLPNE